MDDWRTKINPEHWERGLPVLAQRSEEILHRYSGYMEGIKPQALAELVEARWREFEEDDSRLSPLVRIEHALFLLGFYQLAQVLDTARKTPPTKE